MTPENINPPTPIPARFVNSRRVILALALLVSSDIVPPPPTYWSTCWAE
jgi:hypothetical protein